MKAAKAVGNECQKDYILLQMKKAVVILNKIKVHQKAKSEQKMQKLDEEKTRAVEEAVAEASRITREEMMVTREKLIEEAEKTRKIEADISAKRWAE